MKQVEITQERLTKLASELGIDINQLELSKDPEANIAFLPEEYINEFFEELVKARGIQSAGDFIERQGTTLSEAFLWHKSKKGHKFWENVEKEIKANYIKQNVSSPCAGHCKCSEDEELSELVKEAEARGFAEGVSTKWGVIRSRRNPESEPIDHELQDDGSFFYYNIKVRNKKGKWVKPNVKPKRGYTQCEIDYNNSKVSAAMKSDSDAIHGEISAFLKSIIKQR